jgi:hypothetical protein
MCLCCAVGLYDFYFTVVAYGISIVISLCVALCHLQNGECRPRLRRGEAK